MYICLKDVYTGHLPAHLSERCGYWVFPCTSVLKDTTSLHSYLKPVYVWHFGLTHLNGVHTVHSPAHLS